MIHFIVHLFFQYIHLYVGKNTHKSGTKAHSKYFLENGFLKKKKWLFMVFLTFSPIHLHYL